MIFTVNEQRTVWTRGLWITKPEVEQRKGKRKMRSWPI